MLPSFIIIGAQKSASTFLVECLREHPEIYMPKGEIPFFESPDYEKQSLVDLEEIFNGHENKVLGFKRPNYIGKEEVPARIYKDLPRVKLIAVLRNPIDRVVSAYFHYIKDGFLPVLPLNEGINLILSDDKFLDKYPRAAEILEFGLYYKYLELYLDYFDNRQLKVYLHHEISKKPEVVIKDIFKFLNVNQDYSPSNITSRPLKAVYSPKRLFFNRFITHMRYKYLYNNTRLEEKELSVFNRFFIKACLYVDQHLLSQIYPALKPQLTKELRGVLINYYRNDIEQLEEMLKTDLSSWKHL